MAARTYSAESDVYAWINRCALNPSRIDSTQQDAPDVRAAQARMDAVADSGLAGLTRCLDEQDRAATT
jgi:hypothetical protein